MEFQAYSAPVLLLHGDGDSSDMKHITNMMSEYMGSGIYFCIVYYGGVEDFKFKCPALDDKPKYGLS